MEQSYAQEHVQRPESDPRRNEASEWIKAIIIAILLVVAIRRLLFAPFIVDGESMQPNFFTNERIIVNQFGYYFHKPKPGDVIVFHVPQEGRDFIKRVIAVPGDTVKVEGDIVIVNGKVISEPYIKSAIEAAHQQDILYNTRDFPNSSVPEDTVPVGHLFVMGDNRSKSEDSRMIGYIPYKNIVGQANLVFWPFKDIHIIKKS